MAVLAQQLTQNSYNNVGFDDQYAYALTFDIGVSNATITRLSLYLRRDDLLSSGIYKISIRPTDGGSPAEPLAGAGEDLWSEDFNSSSINDFYEWVEFTSGLNLELTASTTYAIVVKLFSGSALMRWGKAGSNVYGGGLQWLSTNNGNTTWVTGIGDLTFIIEGSNAPRTVVLSSPTNEDTGIILQPLLEWTIDGTGAEEGDFLFIYIRKDNANFTEDDLIGNFVEAELNTNLQIVAGLLYNTLYYWQVQAANEEADLLDSDVWSFTVTTFRPPAVSVDGGSIPTGINNMLTRKRFVAAANNKIWYENL